MDPKIGEESVDKETDISKHDPITLGRFFSLVNIELIYQLMTCPWNRSCLISRESLCINPVSYKTT